MAGFASEGVALDGLTRADVERAMRAVVPALVESATRVAVTRALHPLTEVDIEEIPTRDDVTAGLTRGDVERAMRAVVPALVGPAVARAIRVARGALD